MDNNLKVAFPEHSKLQMFEGDVQRKRQRSLWNLTNNHRISMDIMGVHRLVFLHMASGKIPRQNHRNSRLVTSKVTGRKLCDTSHILAVQFHAMARHATSCYITFDTMFFYFVTHVEDSPQPSFWRPRQSPFVPVGQRLFLKGKPKNRCKLQPVIFWNGGVNVNLWILKFNEIDVDGYITCLYDVSFILRFILKPFQPLVPSWYTQMFLL